VEVAELAPGDEAAYRALVESDPHALVYATLEFRDFLAAAVGGAPAYLVARRHGDLVGALPAFERTAPGEGTVLNSLPWYGSHGGCVLAPGAGDDVRRALLERFRAAADRPGVLSATMILTAAETAHEAVYADVVEPRARDARIGQVTAIPGAGEGLERELERALRQKTRNLVRKALRQGFEEDVSDDDWAWDYLHATHELNLAAIGGRAKPRAHFDALRAHVPAAWRRLSVARLDGVPVAALLLVRFNRTVEYLTPVIDHEHRPRQPLSFLIWHALLDSARAGCRWWNWGGTWAAQDSLHHFKAGWGAEDRPYSYLIRAREEGVARLRVAGGRAADAFPFYYLYPHALLDADAT
jgi:hypothetical protein